MTQTAEMDTADVIDHENDSQVESQFLRRLWERTGGLDVVALVSVPVLLWMVTQGRAHAGLPLLNGGAVGGYLLGSVLAGVPLVTAVGLAPVLYL